MKNSARITHTADLQVKDRDINLSKSSISTLTEIEKYVENSKSNIHIISGDLFEYPTPNESERKMIYNHISKLCKIPSLTEIIVISGNHDLEKTGKQIDSQIGHTPLNVYNELSKIINFNKFRLFDKTGMYNSEYDHRIVYTAYALEDKENWDKLNESVKEENIVNEKIFNISLFHDMLLDYVEYDNIPLRYDQKAKLKSLDFFVPNTIVMAGDIHKTLVFEDEENKKKFIYPGSPIQHTFGEGNYYDVGKDVSKKYAQNRLLTQYEVDLDNFNDISDVKIYNIELGSTVHYNTIILDHKTPWEVLKINLEHLELPAGKDLTLVKIKSVNTFVTKEAEIYDIIHKQLNGDFKIMFDYEKFVQVTDDTNNKVIESIIDEKTKELSENSSIEHTKEDILSLNTSLDDLLLNEEQLGKLFGNVLEQAIDKLSNVFDSTITEDTISDDVKQMFAFELSKVIDNDSSRFNIELKSVETNGFMLLGETKLPLDSKGIVRILGTNAVGKTTLFKLLRWIIDGTIDENMSSNTVVKNNLLVFNKKLPDNNKVYGCLILDVNGTEVTIERELNRVWKKDVEDIHKLDLNKMQQNVAKLDRSFKVSFISKAGEEKILEGDNAQNNVSLWFGNTLNTILFLNQHKIESILKTSPDKLNEMILKYIGVDYLDKLEAGLDNVKLELMSIPKPKKKLDQIHEEIVDAKINVKNQQKLIDELNTNKDTASENLKNMNIKQQVRQKQLVEYGNIPALIDTTEESINNNKDELTYIVSKNLVKKQTKKVEIQSPKKSDDIDIFEKQANDIQLNINSIEQSVVKKQSEISDAWSETITDCNNKITELTDKNSDIQSKVDKLKQAKSKIFDDKLEQLNEKKNSLIVETNNLSNSIDNKQTTIKELISKIDRLNNSLNDDICPQCGTVLVDKNKLEERKNLINDEILTIKENIKTLKSEITDNQELKVKNDDKLKLIDEYIDKLKQRNIEIITNEETRIKIQKIDDKLLKFDVDLKFNDFQITTYIKYKSHEDIDLTDQRIEESVLEFISEQNKMYTIYDETLQTFRNEIKKLSGGRDDLRDKAKNLQEKYNSEVESYNETLNNVNKWNERIIEHNNSIEELINKKIELLTLLNIETSKLNEYKAKLDGYNVLKSEIENSQSLIDDLTVDIENNGKNLLLCVDKLNAFNNVKLALEKEEQDYIEYNKNNIIWKIYSSLIKNNFKHVVFDYYRVYLNNTLNYLLSDVNFKLYWNYNSDLTMVSIDNGITSYQSVHSSSGMEISFLGLSLIYMMHILNVKNTVSGLFIDEISGTLNKGTDLKYEAANYQELFVKMLSKFKDKTIFLIDHNIEGTLGEISYIVVPDGKTSKYEQM